MLYDLGELRVQTHGNAYFIAPDAAVIGRVELGHDANIWFGAVLRGDTNQIAIGDRSNIQDNAVVHVDHDAPATIGTDGRCRGRAAMSAVFAAKVCRPGRKPMRVPMPRRCIWLET